MHLLALVFSKIVRVGFRAMFSACNCRKLKLHFLFNKIFCATYDLAKKSNLNIFEFLKNRGVGA